MPTAPDSVSQGPSGPGSAPPDVLSRPGRHAAPRWLLAWLAVESAGLAATVHFDWVPFLQPVVAAGLLGRALTFGALLGALGGALPGGGPDITRARTAGALALVLSVLLLIDFIPPTFTEAGWDALVGLLVAAQLTAAALFLTRAVSRAALALRLPDIARRAASLPLAVALVLAALLPAISPALSPTPWLSPVAAIAAIAAASGARALPSASAITAITVVVTAALAFADNPDRRAFPALAALVALVAVGLALRGALAALRDAMDRMESARDALAGRPLPPTLEEAARGEPLTEADAVALVDAELGLDAPPLDLPEVSTAEAEAIREPFVPTEAAPPPPAPPPAPLAAWGGAAEATRLLGRAWLALGVAFLFAFFFALSPLGEVPAAVAIGVAVLGGLVGIVALALWRLDDASGPPRGRLGRRALVGAISAASAAVATLAGALLPGALDPLVGDALAIVRWLGLWLALVFGLAHLREASQAVRAAAVAARLRNLVAACWFLGAVGLAAVAHRLLAPGDMQWLGAPLRIAAGVVGAGLFLAMAFAIHDAQERLDDEAARTARRAA